MRIEQKILSNLIFDENYCRKVIPFIKKEYFADRKEVILADEIVSFFTKYNKPASKEILQIEISNRKDLNDKELSEIGDFIGTLSQEPVNADWMLEHTEKFCKDRAVYNGVLSAIRIIDGNDKHQTKDAIPSILSDALAVSFDNHIGHDYLDDHNERYDFYHRVEEKVAFDKHSKQRQRFRSLNECKSFVSAQLIQQISGVRIQLSVDMPRVCVSCPLTAGSCFMETRFGDC